jgi:hypothetical protein
MSEVPKKKHKKSQVAGNAPEVMTNKKFAAENVQFRNACEAAGLKLTKRQASKWRRHTGLAYQLHRYGETSTGPIHKYSNCQAKLSANKVVEPKEA